VIPGAENYAWYAARAGGMLAFVLLTASVVVGLLLSGRARLDRCGCAQDVAGKNRVGRLVDGQCGRPEL
jgi:hypothetical protein